MKRQRHFEKIAATIAGLPVKMRERVAKEFVAALAPTNPLFKPALFLAACGVAK